MVGSPPIRVHSWYIFGFAVLLAGIVLMHWLVLVQGEPTLTVNVPLSIQRSLILVVAHRMLDAAPDTSGPRIHELRLRIGDEDRKQDSYRQVLDLTLPLWPVSSLVHN